VGRIANPSYPSPHFPKEVSAVSEPLREADKTDLKTMLDWRMIAVGAGLGAAMLAAVLALALLAEPRPVADGEQVAAAPPAPVARTRAVRPLPPLPENLRPPQWPGPAKPVVAQERSAPPELIPPPTPVPPIPVAVAPAPNPPAPPPQEVARQEEPPAPEPPAFKRMPPYNPYDDAELLYLLDKQAVEVDLDAVDGTSKKVLAEAAKAVKTAVKATATEAADGKDGRHPLPGVQPILDVIASRADLKGLPVRKGNDCVAGAKEAEALSKISRGLRGKARSLSRTQTQAESPSRYRDLALATYLADEKGFKDAVFVPGLVQMLQTEGVPVRYQLIALLAALKGEQASAALAQRAVFDPSPAVREEAVAALAKRPHSEFRRVLLDALRYPWAPAAEHAAEALVALRDEESVFALADLLDQPDPAAPVKGKDNKWAVTEVVRVNHLRNCLLCHAPSSSDKERVRGLVPEKGKELPELYYESQKGTFVRADVVYLKQDFSVLRPVPDDGKWPVVQRFDYLTRRRELTEAEAERLAPPVEGDPPAYRQRGAVLWVLRELTGEDVGDRSEDWYWLLVKCYLGMDG
jgi:hypothetical protein